MSEIDLGIAAYEKGDYSTAFSYFSKASQADDGEGHLLLAVLYFQGHGVEKNAQKAAELFEQAARYGIVAAHTNLGLMYHTGEDIEANAAKALHHYHEAAMAGDHQSSFNLGQIFRKGWGDISPMPDKAFFYYRLGAEYGHLWSINEYALMFAQGLGAPTSYIEAYAWLKYSADNNDPSAQKNLDQLIEILERRGELQTAKIRSVIVSQHITLNTMLTSIANK